MWADPARTRMLEDVYNERFNRIHPREYDGSYLTFPGISADIDLYPHQRKAVARILQSEEGTLVAHVVGAGKTFTGVAACHEAKRLGRASKPMIVVPNHLTEQWAKDYLTLYPDANILSMTEADGTGKGAARFWAKVAAGDWDAVIVRQDTFQRMHVSPERRENYFSRRKAEMLKSIETAKSDGNDFSAKNLKDEIGKMEKSLNRTVKQAEKDRMRVDGKLQALRGGEDNKEWIDFEDLGVDPFFYCQRPIALDEVTPWSHMDYGITHEYLVREYNKALAAQTTPPCNRACNACGANHLLGGPCFDYSQNLV